MAGLKQQITKIAQQAASQYVQSYVSVTQIQQATNTTQFYGQIIAWTGAAYAVGFPDGTTQNCNCITSTSHNVGDAVLVVQGIIIS